ncbi:MAG: serpin family protein [Paludibacteraceae bacterium]|nr:serpin family protein [Paludibacteraceae bacterium]
MKKLTILLLLVSILPSCDLVKDADVENTKVKEIVLRAPLQKRVAQDNDFAFELLRKTIANNDNENVFLSPMSVSIALGMALNGAENETEAQIADALRFNDMTYAEINEYYKIMQSNLPVVDPKVKLSIANAVWYDKLFSVKQSFLDVNAENFDAYIKMLDFKSADALDTINSWCSRKTNKLIPTILDEIPADAAMYLTNAVYFKGLWSQKFDKKNTREAEFRNMNNQNVRVNMMSLKDTFMYREDEMAQYLTMSYGGKAFSMTVMLPAEGKTTDELLAELDAAKWQNIQDGMSSREVQVFMPRLKVENKFKLKQTLADMGMPVSFTEMADFTGISDIPIMISDVIHKTYVTVDEDGTEAAAVTAVEFEFTSMPEHKEFNVNKTFVFVISEKSTGVILFAGKIGNPDKY